MIGVSIGTRTSFVAPKLMRPRRAVPKIPARYLVALGLPLNKSCSLPTHSESTLPQPLIPLDFISFISNVYRKPVEGVTSSQP